MPENAQNQLLLEEYKQAFQHCRYLEANRGRYVIGALAVTGFGIGLANVKVVSEPTATGASISLASAASLNAEVALSIVFFLLGVLCLGFYQAHVGVDPLLKHYEEAIKYVRTAIYGIGTEEAKVFDTRENLFILGRSKWRKASCLSQVLLLVLSVGWFFAGGWLLLCSFTGDSKMDTQSVQLAETLKCTILWAIVIICCTVIITTSIRTWTTRSKALKTLEERVGKLEELYKAKNL